MKVAVFGLGYVGTVSAACLADQGHDVWGVDIEDQKVSSISKGESPVIEPGLGELVARSVSSARLHATKDVAAAMEGADVSLICVGTPSAPSGGTDLGYVFRATEQIAEALTSGEKRSAQHAVVVRSTVPPGTVDELALSYLAPLGSSVGAAMCPEFLREGSGVADFFDPPFTVIGTSDAATAELLTSLFSFLDGPVRIVPTKTAESLKYACNAFHATKVAFANELARVFRPVGVDAREVMEIFCEDRRLNISPSYLRPGFAFGGPCLPKDLRSLLYLGRVNSVDMPLLSGVVSTNEVVISDVVSRVVAEPAGVVAIIGLSFKSSSDDLRESPNVRLAETLLGKGYTLRIYDPIVNPSKLVGTNLRYVESRLPHLQRLLADSPTEALAGADVVIVADSHRAVVEALVAERPKRILDLTGRLGSEVELLPGYEGVGW